jgi:tol-pal system protein YbgF
MIPPLRPGRRTLPTLCAAIFLGTLAIDAKAANREHQQLMADIRMLQEQTQQLQVTLNALNEVLKVVTGRLDEQGSANRKAFADQKLLIDSFASDVRTIREKLDDTNVRISSLSQEVEAMRTTLTTLPALQPPPAVPPDPSDPTAAAALPEDAAGTPPAPLAPSTVGLSPQRMYDSAYADFASGQWSLAILGFEQYIKAFPRTEQADNAQLNIGDAHYSDGKFDQAVAAYERVIANYPAGDAVPMAYYKRGLALERLKQLDRARESWQTVIEKYPNSDESRLAKQGLDRLAKSNR